MKQAVDYFADLLKYMRKESSELKQFNPGTASKDYLSGFDSGYDSAIETMKSKIEMFLREMDKKENQDENL